MKPETRNPKHKALKKYVVDGYYPTIGIECHVQLKTKTKLFSSVSNEAREAAPNTLVSHICFGLPGALPVLNGEAVRLAAKAAYALGTTPQKFSKFDRKHYFYPDLPKGYQISQYDEPIILGGSITIHLDDGSQKTINITRAHMEEDAGKSTHPDGTDYSLVDLNRAGTPLLEIVSEPEIHNSAEAKAYARELWLRMKYAGVSDVDLYHGNMRFDVNVSVSKDPEVFGTRTETKNLNSFKAVERAVDYEIKRQIELLEAGESIVQETRGWLDDKQKTVSQRSKEDAHDYRYFPDPDIPPIELDDAYLQEIEKDLPDMPDDYRNILSRLDVDAKTVEDIIAQPGVAGTVMSVFNSGGNNEDARRVAFWMMRPVDDDSTHAEGEITHFVTAKQLVQLSGLVSGGKLSSTAAKTVLDKIRIRQHGDPFEVAKELNLLQVSDESAIAEIVSRVLADNPKPVADVQAGEMKAIGFLVGQVMKASQGKANPAVVQQIIKKQLGV